MKKRSPLRRLPLPRRPLEWGLAILAVALVVIAVTSLGSGSSSSSAATKRTATVGKGVVQSTVSGNGTLEPAQKVELNFGASGEVTAIDVKAGQKVKKGQILAEVDSSSARASLATAEAKLIEAEEAVEKAAETEANEEEVAYEGGATSLLVGYMSKEGTSSTTKEEAATSTSTSAGSEATEAAAGQEKSDGSEGAKNSEGAKGSEESKGSEEAKHPEEATRSEEKAAPEEKQAPETSPSMTTGGASESAAPVEVGASGGGGGESSSGASTGASSSAGASVSLPTAEANLREAELAVKSARQEVRETTLRAPISGTIASIAGSVGESVSGGSSTAGGTSEAAAGGAIGGESTSSGSGSAFIVLAQLHQLKVEVSFSEADIGKVRKGQTATVAIDSMEGTELAGRITKVSLLPSESSTGVVEYPATILLTQSAKGLRVGMSASAEVVVEQVKNAITVSSEALTGKSVTVEENGKEVTKTVTTGLEGDETTQIISGLKVGETVVLPEAKVATGAAGGAEGTTGGFGGFGGGFAGGGAKAFGGGGGPPAGGFPGGR